MGNCSKCQNPLAEENKCPTHDDHCNTCCAPEAPVEEPVENAAPEVAVNTTPEVSEADAPQTENTDAPTA